MNRTIALSLVAVAATFGLSGCFSQRPDPCTTQMPAATAEQIAKVQRGLEVDESIEDGDYEVECVLTVDRNGTATWVSEVDD